jgi:hypothetical protein
MCAQRDFRTHSRPECRSFVCPGLALLNKRFRKSFRRSQQRVRSASASLSCPGSAAAIPRMAAGRSTSASPPELRLDTRLTPDLFESPYRTKIKTGHTTSFYFCALRGIRTHDHLLKRELLYQLSYERYIQIKDKKNQIRDNINLSKNINLSIILPFFFICSSSLVAGERIELSTSAL